MWLNDTLFKEDLDYLVSLDYIPWEKLRGQTVMITGATGLIGYNLVSGLIYANIKKKLNLKIIALIRDIDKAEKKFAEQLQDCETLTFMSGEVEHLPDIQNKVDFIVHCACPTASVYFIEHPVETIKTAVEGTINILDLAKEKKVKGVAYLSSMEVYGSPRTENVLTEDDLGYMNPLLVRNCYSESKRQCEAMCAAYASEYGIHVMSIRLAQTFGLGVEKGDSRVFAEFARCAIEKKDIVLLTEGSSKRCYLYTIDAVSAILTVLLKGEPGQAYNAANPETYCSVKEMAEIVARTIGKTKIKVEISEDKEKSKKFSPPHFYNLGIERIMELGWSPSRNLIEMYQRIEREWVKRERNA